LTFDYGLLYVKLGVRKAVKTAACVSHARTYN